MESAALLLGRRGSGSLQAWVRQLKKGRLAECHRSMSANAEGNATVISSSVRRSTEHGGGLRRAGPMGDAEVPISFASVAS